MSKPAEQYLKLRSLGAPAVLLSLAMQGVFRGLKDTKTPLYATGIHSNQHLPSIYQLSRQDQEDALCSSLLSFLI